MGEQRFALLIEIITILWWSQKEMFFNKEKVMKILLVEDDRGHMREALQVLEAAGVEVLQARDLSKALDVIRKHGSGGVQLDGVITDIFFPQDLSSPYHHQPDQPCGIGVALEAERVGLPFVMCTAGYHHGAKYEWIRWIEHSRGWAPMVDAYPSDDPYHSEASHKDWDRALESLTKEIQKKSVQKK